MESKLPINSWHPTTIKEMRRKGWEQADVVLFTGDAYVDHPSFGAALIARVLESKGYKVAIIAQPNWQDDLRDFKKMGTPRLCFAVTAGAMDSMVNHYTANNRLRSDDAYTAGGEAGFRPDRASVVYSNILKDIYPDIPIVVGGIEASMRRLTHYDFWEDKLHHSLLLDSQADILVYGMGEKPMIEICDALDKGSSLSEMRKISQTVIALDSLKEVEEEYGTDFIQIASHKDCVRDKRIFAKNFQLIDKETSKRVSQRIVQESGEKHIVVNPSNPPLETKEIDSFYDLDFTRLPHPKYNKRGEIPAYTMIRHSINSHRGCFGGCSFCAIAAHQGKEVSSRSEESILKELKKTTKMPDFKGHITDVGGPTANMYKMKGVDDKVCAVCTKYSCIYPRVCSNLDTDHSALLKLYDKVQQHHSVNKLSIGSGIRYDLFLGADEKTKRKYKHKEYFENLVKNHISGRLKVAPEHTEDHVLRSMRKPSFNAFLELKEAFSKLNKKMDTAYQIVPYLISAHPNCELQDMVSLTEKMQEIGIQPTQVQAFTPTPMTAATVMYYSGLDIKTLKPIFVAKKQSLRKQQHSLFFWHRKEVRSSIEQELKRVGKHHYIKQLYKKKNKET